MLPPPERAKALAAIAPTAVELAALEYEWRRFWARPKQVAPSWRWSTWLVLAGRGFGKTRTGAEWCREVAESGRCKRLHLVARTAADVRDVLVGGESGILAISPPWFRPRWEPSKRLLTWPNGAIALTYSADEPDQLRGPQCDGAWADELAAWRYPDAWDQLQFGLRLGSDPQCVVTTTPRPTPIIRALVDDATTAVTRGSTYENRGNLAPAFVQKILSKYEGTRLGRQELLAEILDDAPGALWKRDDIERARVKAAPQRGFRRVVVAVDPAASVSEDSDETGIVVVGLGFDGHAYVLDDASGKYTPSEWARQVCRLYREWGADAVIGEVNNGGDMVGAVVHTEDKTVRFVPVRASRGKQTRAEPIAALYEQGKVHHVGLFAELEDQFCIWDPLVAKKSPDRLDAAVWGLTEFLPALTRGPQTGSAMPPSTQNDRRSLDGF